LENKFSKIIGNRYVIFERKENNDKVINLVVDMYNPQNPVTLPLPS
jgi:hypothetical protein